MLANESGTTSFDLPEEVLEVLPADPFEQLDVARKITSIALSTRVSALESEASSLQAKLADKDLLLADLHSQIESLDFALSDTVHKLSLAEQDKERLLKENESLSNTVKKLNRDVSKLESFRKTLMQSLKEDEESSGASPRVVAKQITAQSSLSSASIIGGGSEDDATSGYSSVQSQSSEIGNSFMEDRETDGSRVGISHGFLLASQTNTPHLTPLGSPPTLSASVSPRRHSISISSSRGLIDDRSSVFSSGSTSQHGSMSSSESGSQTGRTRVDGKEFFRQVRSRLSYEQFSAFLANVKELNSHKQTREETLKRVDEIFGPDNRDLYAVFEGLITRNTH